MAKRKTKSKKKITTLTHSEDKRTNILKAELELVLSTEDASPIRVAIEPRNPDLDPQLVDDLKRDFDLDEEADDPGNVILFSRLAGYASRQ